jgi:hypothetical protein
MTASRTHFNQVRASFFGISKFLTLARQDSQNFSRQNRKLFKTLGLNTLKLSRMKGFFEQILININMLPKIKNKISINYL